jgi:fatty acid desaturase
MVATVTGFILWLPPNYFRAFHLEHHRWTQVRDRDPELTDKNLDTIWRLLLHLSGYRYWHGNIGALIHHARGQIKEPYINPSKSSAVIVEARYFLVTYALCLVGSIFVFNGVLILYWWIPLLLGQPLLRLYLLAEHTLCPFTTDMFRNTRTTLTSRLVRFISWNMPYHAEHHASMAIPFHALPAAHQLLQSRVKMQKSGYIAFHRQLLETLRSR